MNNIKFSTFGNGVFISDEHATLFVSNNGKVLVNRNHGHQFYREFSIETLTKIVNELKKKGVKKIIPSYLLME